MALKSIRPRPEQNYENVALACMNEVLLRKRVDPLGEPIFTISASKCGLEPMSATMRLPPIPFTAFVGRLGGAVGIGEMDISLITGKQDIRRALGWGLDRAREVLLRLEEDPNAAGGYIPNFDGKDASDRLRFVASSIQDAKSFINDYAYGIWDRVYASQNLSVPAFYAIAFGEGFAHLPHLAFLLHGSEACEQGKTELIISYGMRLSYQVHVSNEGMPYGDGTVQFEGGQISIRPG